MAARVAVGLSGLWDRRRPWDSTVALGLDVRLGTHGCSVLLWDSTFAGFQDSAVLSLCSDTVMSGPMPGVLAFAVLYALTAFGPMSMVDDPRYNVLLVLWSSVSLR